MLAVYNRKPDSEGRNIGDWDTDQEATTSIQIRDEDGLEQSSDKEGIDKQQEARST